MVGCLVGAHVLGFFLARSILIPIDNLLQGVKKITSGDLSHELPIRSKDELGSLAMAFNSMARQLKELFGTLEQRVEAATQELQSTLAYMAAIIDNMADGLFATDQHGDIMHFNPALKDMFELQTDHIVGKDTADIFDDEVSALVGKTCSGTEKYYTSEIKMAHGRIGKAVAAAISQDAAHADNGQCSIGSVVLIRDVTKEKEVDQMKTDFISTVSHELRTPLTSVLGFAKIIKKRFEKALLPQLETVSDKKTLRAVNQVKENLEIIIAEGERLTTLINDVLDIAKMEAGKIDWKMEKLSIVEIIDRATVATSALFAQKQLAQIKDIEDDLPEITGDRDRLIQVVINLISNAVKFTDDGSVTCKAYRTDNEIVVNVIDTGSGIAEADQPKVFEKFKQVGDTLTDKPKGTGLGLPICKQIIEHHGGKIWVESTLGEGSTFIFTLPILTEFTHELRIMPTSEFLQKLETRLATGPMTCVNEHPVILVVDDELQIRKLLRQELKTAGYLVKEAQNGKEALAEVNKEHPCLILLDVMMPEMNGFEVASMVKSDPLSTDIPIVILSIIPEREVGYRFGIDSYLTKPVDSDKLLQEVSTLLAQGARRRKVLALNEQPDADARLGELLHEIYHVTEVQTMEALKAQALADLPDIIITTTVLAERHDLMNTLRAEAQLEHTFFLLLEDDTTDGITTT
ncbi:response regulator [candidate division KSB3 bacterium]|uniref:histidine kinase n=1 Tax=candidate division KSB3 bacterium TaxID=2044937 RepID=A0A9D5Q6V3_9BACT|nr:response regulator [candidate division KSB3 bacterium]MBD3325617.1 response regulator [candidate division KSB3 bacterium]